MRKKLAAALIIVTITAVFVIYKLESYKESAHANFGQAITTTEGLIESTISEESKDVNEDTEDSMIQEDKEDRENDKEPKEPDEIVEVEGLVELLKLDDSFLIDLKYAGTDNFMGQQVYTVERCLINKNTAKKLIAANDEFKNLGYSIKVFDAYRPYSAQKILWDLAPDKSYVANPKNGSIHNRGAAVDITLVDLEGNELEMPSDYDEMTKRSHIDYSECDEKLIKNRELLGSIMVKHGFRRIRTEWWHFEDTDAKNYPILDIDLESFP